jgi:hypothetical protein
MSDYGGEILRRQLAGKNENDGLLASFFVFFEFHFLVFPLQRDSSVMEFQTMDVVMSILDLVIWRGVQDSGYTASGQCS